MSACAALGDNGLTPDLWAERRTGGGIVIGSAARRGTAGFGERRLRDDLCAVRS